MLSSNMRIEGDRNPDCASINFFDYFSRRATCELVLNFFVRELSLFG